MASLADADDLFLKMLEAFVQPQSAPQLSIEQAPRSAKFRKKVPLSKSTADHSELARKPRSRCRPQRRA
jgi:hypothetical protein